MAKQLTYRVPALSYLNESNTLRFARFSLFPIPLIGSVPHPFFLVISPRCPGQLPPQTHTRLTGRYRPHTTLTDTSLFFTPDNQIVMSILPLAASVLTCPPNKKMYIRRMFASSISMGLDQS